MSARIRARNRDGVQRAASKQAQLRYESGERDPGAEHLAAIAAHGADVLYIVTGKRGRRGA